MLQNIKRWFSAKEKQVPVPFFITCARAASSASEQEDHTLAIDLYTQAIEVAPDVADLYSGRALSYDALGMRERALEDINKAIIFGATDCYELKAHYSTSLGRYNEAVESWTYLIEENQDNVWFYLFRGQCYESTKNWTAAFEDLKVARKLKPDEVEIYISMSVCLANIGEYDEVLSVCETGLGYDPYTMELIINKAIALAHTERYEEALTCYELALNKGLDSKSAILYNRGILYIELEQYENALNDFENLLLSDPAYGNAYYGIGLLHKENGRFADARSAYQKALELGVEKAEAALAEIAYF